MYGVAEIARAPLTRRAAVVRRRQRGRLARDLRGRRRVADEQGHRSGVTSRADVSSQTQHGPPTGGCRPPARPVGWGPVFAAIWLFFLLDPLLRGLGTTATLPRRGSAWSRPSRSRRSTCRSVACGCARDRAAARRRARRVDRSVACLGALVALGVAHRAPRRPGGHGRRGLHRGRLRDAVPVPGGRRRSLVVAASSSCVGRPRCPGLGQRRSAWPSRSCAASVAIFGIPQMMTRNIELVRAHEENARLAVDNERTRFARDLHDILGHSLTVITVKAELGQTGCSTSTPTAPGPSSPTSSGSRRDALADVRRAVEGYRELTLPGELARARAALRGRRDRRRPAELDRRRAVRPARAVRLDGPRGRHQRDPAQRRARAARCGSAAHERRGARRRRRRAEPGAAHGSRADRAARAGRRRSAATVVTRSLDPGLLARRSSRRDDDRSGCCSPTTRRWSAARSSALLGLEPDLEVVAEVGTGDAGRTGRARAPPRRRAARRRDARARRHQRRPPRCARVARRTRVLIVTTFGRPGYLRRALQAGRRRVRRQGHPGGPARRRRTPGARRACASSTRRWPPTAWSPATRR